MKNRFLFVGDLFWGDENGVPEAVCNGMILKATARPFEFVISSSEQNTLEYLFLQCPRKIIGKQAGTIILCAGHSQILRRQDTDSICLAYKTLVTEILHNTHSRLILCTIPEKIFEEDSTPQRISQIFNEQIRNLKKDFKLEIADFDRAFSHFLSMQAQNEDHIRNLHSSPAQLTSLGKSLFSSLLLCALPEGIPCEEPVQASD
jgi:hypothetical protein